MSLEGLNFDSLVPIEVPVMIDGTAYLLREASAEAGCQYRNALLACTQLGPEGTPVSIRGMADVEPLLVSLCLVKAEGNQHVTLATIRSWPGRIVTALFNRAKAISGLDETMTEEAAKNSPGATPDGSG